jgi:hypothetical protein
MRKDGERCSLSKNSRLQLFFKSKLFFSFRSRLQTLRHLCSATPQKQTLHNILSCNSNFSPSFIIEGKLTPYREQLCATRNAHHNATHNSQICLENTKFTSSSPDGNRLLGKVTIREPVLTCFAFRSHLPRLTDGIYGRGKMALFAQIFSRGSGRADCGSRCGQWIEARGAGSVSACARPGETWSCVTAAME